MKSLASYLLVMFMAMFWIFRIVVAFTMSMGINIGIVAMDLTVEIVLLFVTLVSMILVIKRSVLGGILYLGSYGAYFGIYLFNTVQNIIKGNAATIDYGNAFFSLLAILLAVSVLLELLFDKNSKNHPKDKKTDWFYKNEQFDRKKDERADQNNYRMY